MYENILYPTDGSQESEAVLEHVRDLAETYDARIHILFVVDSKHGKSSMTLHRDEDGKWKTGMVSRATGENRGGMSKNEIDVLEVLQQEGDELTQQIAAELQKEGYKTATACKRGKPHQVINTYAETNDIDLIAMGTHGRSGVSRQLIGSVTEKVIRTTDTPVLTARLAK